MNARIEQLTRSGRHTFTRDMRALTIRDEFFIVNLYDQGKGARIRGAWRRGDRGRGACLRPDAPRSAGTAAVVLLWRRGGLPLPARIP